MNPWSVTTQRKRYIGIYRVIVLLLVISGCTSCSGKATILTTAPNPTPSSTIPLATTTPSTIPQTSQVTKLPTIQTVSSPTLSLVIPTARETSISPINQLIPEMASASEIIDTSKISSFFLKQADPIALGMDDRYVYWVDHRNPGFLYRISQSGGKPEVVAKSLYADGRLDCIDLQNSKHWLIFCDTPRSNDLVEWKIRAINLDDLSQKVLLSDENGTNLITFFDISLNESTVIWVITTQKGNELDENVITCVNLDNGERRDILRKKADTSIWSLISLSGNQAVIEEDFDQTQGEKNVLHLLDLTNRNMSDLSMDGVSSMPDFSFPYVIWKHGARYDFMRSFVLYNLDDEKRYQVTSYGEASTDSRINGSWVYWRASPTTSVAGNAIYIYEIGKNTTYTLETPGPDQFYESVYIFGSTIAWIRDTEFSQAVHDAYIEWATIR